MCREMWVNLKKIDTARWPPLPQTHLSQIFMYPGQNHQPQIIPINLKANNVTRISDTQTLLLGTYMCEVSEVTCLCVFE